ncbi:hypothetical protein FQA39_LY19387 [Lamprigera yunnana]|nr:hypothetical protein FQA39_LY19387 [Lamprigera yunnana]
MNPCLGGYAFNQDSRCHVLPKQLNGIKTEFQVPYWIRIDPSISMSTIKSTRIYRKQDQPPVEDSATVSGNGLSPKDLEKYVILDETSKQMLEMAQQRLNLSDRAYHRILRVSRTIADFSPKLRQIQSAHLTEALSYRGTQSRNQARRL